MYNIMYKRIGLILCVAVIVEHCGGSPLLIAVARRKREVCRDEEQFTCVSGQCIDLFNLCDGIKDCFDGSDETIDGCKQFNIPCPTYTFRCNYGACITSGFKCDGKVDCADGSDEEELLCNIININPNSTNTTALTRFNNGCILPQYPENGFYLSKLCLPGECNPQPGSIVPNNWVLIFHCKQGYQLPEHNQFAFCMETKWTPPLPICTMAEVI